MTTGELIQARRKEAGMTQAELGKKLGISGAGIAQWENNLRKPKKETLSRIASALYTNISYMPDEQEERLLLRLRNEPIVPDEIDGKSEIVFRGLTAFWRDAVGLYGSPTCSECGGSSAVKTRFCPHCGARMENFVAEKR